MPDENQVVELLGRMSDDLRALRKSVTRLARESYKQDLVRIASTPERQEMWRLCDGTLSNEEIAKRIGVKLRTVQYFVQEAEKAGLIEMAKRGYPKRTDDFNIVPEEWKPYRKPAVAQPASDMSPAQGGTSA